MARDFAKKFYNSKQWQQARKAYIISKVGICERCGTPNSNEVHHKEELNEFNINNPDIALNFDNFELLCKPCHSLETNNKYSPLEEGYSFDANGDLIYSPPVKI